MNDIVKEVFAAPLGTVFVVSGLIFLFIAVAGNISGKIEPGTRGRIVSGIFGLIFIILGLSLHLSQRPVDSENAPADATAQTQPTPETTPASDSTQDIPSVPDAPIINNVPPAPTHTETQASQAVPVTASPEDTIEAGCSFSGNQIEGETGSLHAVACPDGCDESGAIYGTDNYTGDSSICRAAIHAGLIGAQGGTVRVVLDKGRPAYRGSMKNGITSHDWGKYRSSFHFATPQP